MQWSLIIPAYNEVRRLGKTLDRVLEYREQAGKDMEILVINDGSTDGTGDLVREKYPAVEVLENPGNRGKGYSVRHGLQKGRGEWILFSDADLSTPIEEMEHFEECLRNGADMVIASRALPDSVLEVPQPWWREKAGRIFNGLVQGISGLPYVDTQCGFKAYTRGLARELARLQQLDGWAFDVEQIYLARKMGRNIAEVPVRWINSEDSRVHFLQDAWAMLLDVTRIRLRRYDLPPRSQ